MVVSVEVFTFHAQRYRYMSYDVVPKRQVTDRAISIVFLVKHSGGLNSDACI